MKKNILSIIAVSSLALMLTSCGSMKQNTAFSERKYYNFPHHNPVVVFDNKKNPTHNDVAAINTKQPKQIIVNEQNGLQVVNVAPVTTSAARKTSKSNLDKATPVAKNETPVKQETISSYAPNNEMAISAEHGGGNASGLNTVVLVIIAIFIAPLAVYLYDNAATTRFVIVLVLWLVGIFAWGFIFLGLALLAAIIYAILIVTGNV